MNFLNFYLHYCMTFLLSQMDNLKRNYNQINLLLKLFFDMIAYAPDPIIKKVAVIINVSLY